jgi:hypothetical protein
MQQANSSSVALDEARIRVAKSRIIGFEQSLQASPGRHCHSTLASAGIGGHSLVVYTLILLPLLSFSVRVTVSPRATAGLPRHLRRGPHPGESLRGAPRRRAGGRRRPAEGGGPDQAPAAAGHRPGGEADRRRTQWLAGAGRFARRPRADADTGREHERPALAAADVARLAPTSGDAVHVEAVNILCLGHLGSISKSSR